MNLGGRCETMPIRIDTRRVAMSACQMQG